MLPSRRSGPERSISLVSTTVRILCIAAIALAFCLLVVPTRPVRASGGSLSLGSVTNQTAQSCMGGGWLSGMTCFAATLANCPNAQDLGFQYGYLLPSGKAYGVVVYFDGGDGTVANMEAPESLMLQYYVAQGYEVVQVAWNTPWASVLYPWPPGTVPQGNIQNAACRPATFLNYVATAPASWNLYQAISNPQTGNPKAGMCAQGFSAGSAQIAYSLAYYGLGANLDAVELISGPVLSDVEQGCKVPGPIKPTPICYSGQWGCGSQASWSLYPTYVPNGANYVGNWTNDGSCQGPTATSPASNARWLSQSIVDQGTGATPTFTYPSTAMSAWLCRSLKNQYTNCTGNNYNYDFCPNNSSPQGQIFYEQIGQTNSPPIYNIYAVDQCFGPEGAPQGNVSALPGNPYGQTAIQQDMAGLPNAAPGHCVHSQ